MKAALDYLEKNEWTMGNGQCRECHGIRPFFDGLWARREPEGHKENCSAAEAIRALGGTPHMITDPDPDPSRPEHPVFKAYLEAIEADFLLGNNR